jgi:DNA mismatch repair ATPase MutS
MAAQIVLEQLLESDAMGAITTHDLSLASSDELSKKAVQVHFREEVRDAGGRRELHFDYKLRSGPATSRNALLLLEIVGLGRPTRGS